MKYDFIGTHANDFPVKLLCRQLGVQRSAYYDWRAQPGKLIAPEELALRRRMKELFAASRGSLGSRMMMKNLRQEGFEIGRDKTRRLMKSLQLKVKQTNAAGSYKLELVLPFARSDDNPLFLAGGLNDGVRNFIPIAKCIDDVAKILDCLNL